MYVENLKSNWCCYPLGRYYPAARCKQVTRFCCIYTFMTYIHVFYITLADPVNVNLPYTLLFPLTLRGGPYEK